MDTTKFLSTNYIKLRITSTVDMLSEELVTEKSIAMLSYLCFVIGLLMNIALVIKWLLGYRRYVLPNYLLSTV